MSTVSISPPIHREPELLGQTVVVIGGSAGIGFESTSCTHQTTTSTPEQVRAARP